MKAIGDGYSTRDNNSVINGQDHGCSFRATPRSRRRFRIKERINEDICPFLIFFYTTTINNNSEERKKNNQE